MGANAFFNVRPHSVAASVAKNVTRTIIMVSKYIVSLDLYLSQYFYLDLDDHVQLALR